MLFTAISAGFGLLVIVVLIVFVSRNILRVPPDSALVISGAKRVLIDPSTGERQTVGYRVINGGSTFLIPIFERVDRLPLNEMSIQIDAKDLRDIEGKARSISVLVNCRISEETQLMERAIRRFLTMDLPDIENIVRTTIESRITSSMLTTDLSNRSSWPGIESLLAAEVRADLAGLGVEVDTLIFRSDPTVDASATPANGRGGSRRG